MRILAILIGVPWPLVPICISLMTYDVGHVLIFHGHILGEVSVKVFGRLLSELFVLLLLSFKCSLCILNNSPLSQEATMH